MVIQLRHAPLSASTRAGFRTSLRPLVAALLLALGPRAFALPTDPTVVAGQAVVRGAGGNSLVIDQASGKAAIDWRSFNIGAGEAVRFNQPSAAAMTVNRVTSNNPSEILGLISAPGTVFLINPTGIIFGRTAVVDVGSLVASTLSASTADLLSGRAVFNAAPGGSGAVRNEGSIISAPGGSVSLIGTQVSNSGSIATPGGTTGLIAGERVSVDFEGDGLVRYQVDVGAARALVEQSGHIAADGGRVALQAGARDALVDTVLNVDGVVRARGISQRGGEIYLDGGAHGSVLVSGTLDASGAAPGTAGGQLRVLGENVGLIGGARLDASGEAGGGSVLVGGNYQGSGPEHNATRAFVGSGVTINADALGHGDGGRVITWADDWTRFYGTISARGGAAGGDGGFVEVSGKQSLAFAGSVVTSAPQGRTGTLLLDPDDLYVGKISGGATGANDDDPTSAFLFQANSVLNRDYFVLADSLKFDSKYVLKAQQNVIFNADVAFGTTGGDAAKSVSVEAGAAISSTGANSISTFGGALSLNAGTTINIGAAINTNGGVLTINSPGAATLSGGVAGVGSALVKLGPGELSLSGSNSYSGGTSIRAGTLTTLVSSTLPAGGAVSLEGSGVLNLDGKTQSIGNLIGADPRSRVLLGDSGALTVNQGVESSYAGSISGGNGSVFKKAGNATLHLSAASPDYSGKTEVLSGILSVGGSSNALGSGVVEVSNGASLLIAGVDLITGGLTLNGSGVGGAGALQGAGTATHTGAVTLNTASAIGAATALDKLTLKNRVGGTGPLTKVGDGVLELSEDNNYTGGTTIEAGTLRLLAGATLRTLSPLNLTGTGTFDLSSTDQSIGNLTGTASTAIILGSGDLTVTQGTTGTFAGRISGSGDLIKQGTAALTLSGASTGYSGTTRVQAGTLVATGSASALGTGAGQVFDGATLKIDGVDLITGGLTLNGSGVGGAGALQGAGTASLAGTVTLATASAIGAATGSDTLTVKNQVSGTGPLTKVGDGVVELSGSNIYTGGTTVEAGTLVARNANAFGNDVVRVNNGASLLIAGVDLITGGLTLNGSGVGGAGALQGAGTATHTGAVTLNTASAIGAATALDKLTLKNRVGGTGPLTKVGDGVLELSGDNNYTGGTTIEAGTLRLLAGATLRTLSPLNLTGTGTFDLSSTDQSIGNLTGTADTAITLGSGDLTVTQGTAGTFAGQISGSGDLIKQGTAALTLSGASTGYTGTTRVQAGTLVATGSASALGTGAGQVSNGATLLIDKVDLITGGLTLNGSGVGGAGALQGAGTATHTGTVTLNTASAIGAATASDTLTVKNQVSGTGPLTKVGGGIVAFSVSNTYTGGTTVEAGTLVARNANAFGNDVVRVNNGASLLIDNVALTTGGLTLNGSGVGGAGALQGAGTASHEGSVTLATASAIGAATASDTLTVKNQVSGTGPLTKMGDGVVELSGSNTYTGGTTVKAGTLVARNAKALGNDVVRVDNGASLRIDNVALTTGGLTLNGSGVGGAGALQGAGTATHTGAVTLNTASAIGAATASDMLTLKNQVSGTGPFTKMGDGVVELSGGNDYTGGTTVEAGTLVARNANAFGNDVVRVNNGASLLIDNVALTTGGLTLNGSGVGGAGALQGAGTASFAGAVTLATASAIGAATASDKLTLKDQVSGSGPLTKVGGGVVELSGSNTYTGGTTISEGTLVAGNAHALGVGRVGGDDGAMLRIDDVALSTGGLTLNGNGLGGSGALQGTGTASHFGAVTLATASAIGASRGSTLTLNNPVSGANLTKVGGGVVELSGSNTYTGGTTVDAGTLRLLAGATLPTLSPLNLTGTGTLDLNGTDQSISNLTGTASTAITLGGGDLTVTQGAAGTFAGRVSGSGDFIKQGAATLTLSNASTGFTGRTMIRAGSLEAVADNALGSGEVWVQGGALNVGPAALGNSIVLAGGTLRAIGVTTLTGALSQTVDSQISSALEPASLTLQRAFAGGGHQLTIDGPGSVHLAGGAGGLASIVQSAGSELEVGTGQSIVSSGAQTYGGIVKGSNVTLTSLARRAITATSIGNDFTGTLHVTAGSAQLGGGDTLSVALDTGAATLTAGRALTLSGTAASLDAKSGSGGIGQQAGQVLQVTDTTTLDAGSGAVRLTEMANKFGGLVTVKAGETVLRAGEGLNVVLDNTGATTLTAGQALTVSGTASSLDAKAIDGSIGQPVGQALQVAGETRLDAGSQAVRLTEAANKFGDLVRVSAGETVLRASDDLKVELRTGAATLTAGKALALRGAAASLEATAGDGAITQLVGAPDSPALEVTGTTTLQAGREAVSLTRAANKFGGLVTVKAGQTALSASENLKVALENTDATTLTAGQSLDVSGTAASLETVSGALHFGQTKLAADGKFTAHGSVSQESASALEIGGATTLNVDLQAGESILLANRGNAFGTTLGGKIDLGLAAADSSIHSKNAVRLAKLELTGNGLLEIESSAAMGTTPVQDVRTPVSENSNCTLPRSCVSVQSFDGTPEPLSVFEASISQQKDARITTDPGVTLKLNASSAKGSIDLSAGASVSVTLAGVAQPAATGLAGLLSVYSKAGPEVRKLAYSDSDGTPAHRGTTNQIQGPLAAVTQANTSQDSPDKTAVVVASDTIRVAAKDGIDGDTVMLIAREVAGGGGKIQTRVAATDMRDGRNIKTGVGSDPDPNYSILPSIFVIADAPGGTSAAYSFGSLGNPISVSFGHVDEFTANSLLQTIAVEPYRRGEPGGVVPVYLDTRVQPGVDPNGPIRRFLVFPAGTPTGSIRMVVVDGVEILDSSAFASVQSAVAELLNQVRKEQLESGFSNENVAAQLRKGVITETRVGPAAVDRFQGVAPAGGCVGTMIGEMLVCAPAAGPQQP